MPVARLLEELTYPEFLDWMAFYRQKEEERNKPPEHDWASMKPGEVAHLFGAKHGGKNANPG